MGVLMGQSQLSTHPLGRFRRQINPRSSTSPPDMPGGAYYS